jgi:uncharacterized integral membrane protein
MPDYKKEQGTDIDNSDEPDALQADAQIADQYTYAITPQTDDPSTPAFTVRAVFLGCIWAVFLACCNVLFSFRTNSFSIPTGLAQLLSYPMGILLAWIVFSFNTDPTKLEITQSRSIQWYLHLTKSKNMSSSSSLLAVQVVFRTVSIMSSRSTLNRS